MKKVLSDGLIVLDCCNRSSMLVMFFRKTCFILSNNSGFYFLANDRNYFNVLLSKNILNI